MKLSFITRYLNFCYAMALLSCLTSSALAMKYQQLPTSDEQAAISVAIDMDRLQDRQDPKEAKKEEKRETPSITASSSSSSSSSASSSSASSSSAATSSDTTSLDVVIDIDKQPENPLCNEIAERYQRSIPIETRRTFDEMCGNEQANDRDFYDFFTNEEVNNPTKIVKCQRAFNILSAAEAEQKTPWTRPATPVIDSTTWTDLNLLCGSIDNPSQCLGNIISNNYTQTELGKSFLIGMIARPTNDASVLKARQDTTKLLYCNEELLGQLEAYYKDIAIDETDVVGLLSGTEGILMSYIRAHSYFPPTKWAACPGLSKCFSSISNCLNNSTTVLSIKKALSKIQGVISYGFTVAMPFMFFMFALSSFGVPLGGTLTAIASGFTNQTMAACGLLFYSAFLIPNQYTQGITACVGTLYGLHTIPNNTTEIKVDYLYDNFLRKRFVRVARYFGTMKKIYDLLKSEKNIVKNLAFFKNMHRLFDELPKQNSTVAEMFKLLNTGTFDQRSLEQFSIFFNRGKVFTLYRFVQKATRHLEAAMAGLAEIDAHMAIVKLLKASESQRVKYCFPTYVETGAPRIELKNAWSPFVGPEHVVPNNVALGIDHKVPNMLVTGPNSAGKSTILKSIAIALILAQSIGIAPAQAMTTSIFSSIATYMNVADSQVDQESRFQAEAGRVFKHVRKIDDLAKKNALSFAAFDELFSGTSPAEGTELGYKVAKTLCYFPNSISILATHFQPLTQLEADTNGRYINYRVPVVMNGRGTVSVVNNKVQRTFTLEPGISNQHIAREVFTERGIDQDLLHRILDDGKESETTTASNATLAATASSSSSLTSLSTSSAQTTHLPRQ